MVGRAAGGDQVPRAPPLLHPHRRLPWCVRFRPSTRRNETKRSAFDTRHGLNSHLYSAAHNETIGVGLTHLYGAATHTTESATIHDDVCVLQVSGTAAVLRWPPEHEHEPGPDNNHHKSPTPLFPLPLPLPVAGEGEGDGGDDGARGAAGGGEEAGVVGQSGGRHHRRRRRRGQEGQRGAAVRLRLARPCSFCHLPYPRRTAPFAHMRIVPCQVSI